MAYLANIAVQNQCARFEWIVLDWNTSAIEFYKRLGADVLTDWRICRVGEAAIATRRKQSGCFAGRRLIGAGPENKKNYEGRHDEYICLYRHERRRVHCSAERRSRLSARGRRRTPRLRRVLRKRRCARDRPQDLRDHSHFQNLAVWRQARGGSEQPPARSVHSQRRRC